MDLMMLVPDELTGNYQKFIVHTKYNCVVPPKADEIDTIMKGNNSISWLRRCFLRNSTLSRTHPFIQMHLKSNAVIRYEITKHITLYPRMIHPTSKLSRYGWEWFQIILTYLALLIVPILNTFYILSQNKWWYFMLFINLGFTVDMILCFFTGYIDKTNRSVILDSKLVTSKYLKGMFFVDLLSSFPFELIHIFYLEKNVKISVCSSALNLLTFLRIKNLFTYARNIQYAHRFSLKVYKMFEVTTIIIIVIHWGACLQYFVPIAIEYIGIVKNEEEISWIYSASMQKRETLIDKYILCLNRVMISLVCSTHFLNSIAWEDVIVNTICSFIGKGGFIYLLVQGMQLMTTYGPQNEHFRQKQLLEEYTRQKKLPSDIQKRLHVYCHYTSKKHFESHKNILNDIPPRLQEEIILYNHVHMLTAVDLLKYLPQSIVVQIASLIRTKVYLTNDIIIQCHTHGQELYFIVSGTVAVYTPSGQEVCHLEEGAHFGEITLVLETEYRIASVVAIETCEVGILSHDDFKKVITPFPYIMNRLRKLARKRMKYTLQLEEIVDKKEINIPIVNISKFDNL